VAVFQIDVLRLLIALGCWFAGAACALAQSEPTLKIGRDEARDAFILDSSIDIAAPPATVWKVITDCDRAPKFVPNMESCRVVERGANGSDIHETVINYVIVPRIRTISRMEAEPSRRVSYTRIGGNMRIADVELRLDPLANGTVTRLQYHSVFGLDFFVPHFLLYLAAQRDVPALMKGIERESLADARKR
jgi:hypothetical protein